MNKMFGAFALLCVFAIRDVGAQGAPQIKCDIGTAAWCIANFDGSISMQDAGEFRIWSLQARTARSGPPMKIVETKACSDNADERLRLISSKGGVSSTDVQTTEYVLNSNGCKLRFEIPKGESAATYKQVMLYGILVGTQKRTQLYKAGS